MTSYKTPQALLVKHVQRSEPQKAQLSCQVASPGCVSPKSASTLQQRRRDCHAGSVCDFRLGHLQRLRRQRGVQSLPCRLYLQGRLPQKVGQRNSKLYRRCVAVSEAPWRAKLFCCCSLCLFSPLRYPQNLLDDGGAPCTPGHYCPEGSSVMIPCPAGTYNPDSAKGNAEDCLKCPVHLCPPKVEAVSLKVCA